MALDRADGAVGVGDRLTLGDLADEDLAVLGEGDDARGRAGALGVGDDGGFATLEDRDDRVGGPEVDADGSAHGVAPSEFQHGLLGGLRCGLSKNMSRIDASSTVDITTRTPRNFRGVLVAGVI